MSRRTVLFAACIVLLVVVAGCSGAPLGGRPANGDEPAGEDEPDQGVDPDGENPAQQGATAGGDRAAATGTPAAEATATAAPGGTPGGGRQSAAAAGASRALIRTGVVRLRVESLSEARSRLATKARTLGGYVSDSGQRLHRDDGRRWRTGYVVLRVPKAKFSALLSAARSAGVVLRERTKTRDVTRQLVDIRARLKNLRRKRARLRDFYERANTTEALLRIEDRLSEVQGRIERLRARRRNLKNRVAYATLRVEFRESVETPTPTPTPTPEPTETPEPAYHERSAVGAVEQSAHSLWVLARAAVVTAAYALPYAVLVGLVAVGGYGLLRRRRRKSGSPDRETGEGSDEG